MHMVSYYLTRAELQIFEKFKSKILDVIAGEGAFRIVELGAGDGLKTKVLLKHFLQKKVEFEFIPVDISAHALELLEESLTGELPDLKINSMTGDYFKMLSQLKGYRGIKTGYNSNNNFTFIDIRSTYPGYIICHSPQTNCRKSNI